MSLSLGIAPNANRNSGGKSMDALSLLKEINANYKTTYLSRWCGKCSTYKAHLIATTRVPGRDSEVRREECTECHRGETILKKLVGEPKLQGGSTSWH
jgi:hypothetical protein